MILPPSAKKIKNTKRNSSKKQGGKVRRPLVESPTKEMAHSGPIPHRKRSGTVSVTRSRGSAVNVFVW